jgi:hypothetical protein
MCSTADSLMLTHYVCYNRHFNVHAICVIQQTVKCSQYMCGTGDSLMPTKYVG